jgi:hypothetical protein
MTMESIINDYKIPLTMSAFILPFQEALDKGILTKNSSLVPEKLVGITWDALMPIGVTSEYVKKREFTDLIAVRELLQNALDETEEVFGEPLVNVKTDSLGTWIEDKGRGIPVEAFRIGGGSKETWMRGYFGEGLKIAAAYLVLKNIPVFFFTKNLVFSLVFLPEKSDNPGAFLLLGKNEKTVEGTKILLFGFHQDEVVTQRLVRLWNKELVGKQIAQEYFSSDDSEKQMPSAIFNYPDELYIRNMYIGRMSEVAKRVSLLSYDLWWFRLDVSRKLMTQSIPLLFVEIAKVLERSESCRKIFVEKLVESKMLKITTLNDKPYIEFNPVFATVEGHLFVYACPKGMIDMFFNVLQLSDQKEKVVRVFSEKEAEKAIAEGLIPIQFHYELTEEMNIIPEFKKKDEK